MINLKTKKKYRVVHTITTSDKKPKKLWNCAHNHDLENT